MREIEMMILRRGSSRGTIPAMMAGISLAVAVSALVVSLGPPHHARATTPIPEKDGRVVIHIWVETPRSKYADLWRAAEDSIPAMYNLALKCMETIAGEKVIRESCQAAAYRAYKAERGERVDPEFYGF